jgi:hypothetical protein
METIRNPHLISILVIFNLFWYVPDIEREFPR